METPSLRELGSPSLLDGENLAMCFMPTWLTACYSQTRRLPVLSVVTVFVVLILDPQVLKFSSSLQAHFRCLQGAPTTLLCTFHDTY
ncbi:hypothetical protein Cadr_000007991 [Camelus dromedarius]|uniref:Uncharacterized protein n=1 Tax=Camelus dromedarius TaxID=9838 RepID=A0A5N4DYU1_CAMDR|nr:hypothetical protein Cadr_000007991 [Camelus dromedarius]